MTPIENDRPEPDGPDVELVAAPDGRVLELHRYTEPRSLGWEEGARMIAAAGAAGARTAKLERDTERPGWFRLTLRTSDDLELLDIGLPEPLVAALAARWAGEDPSEAVDADNPEGDA